MGIKNRQRRAAKRRKQRQERGGRAAGTDTGRTHERRSHGTREQGNTYHQDTRYDQHATYDEHVLAVAMVQQAVAVVEVDQRSAGWQAARLTGPDSRVGSAVVFGTVDRLLGEMLTGCLRGGWTPADLGQVVRRWLSALHEPLLAALLSAEAGRHPVDRVHPEWRRELTELAPPAARGTRTTAGLAQALGMCAVLGFLPKIAEQLPPPGATPGVTAPASGGDSRQLARVRALLAKAESTQFPEEAEALSAKAQELVSRYALDRLVDQVAHDSDGADRPGASARRWWIDPPYVLGKALLVDAVAQANRCRTVLSEELGFSTVIGEPSDLAAVELLVTSLLVQANAAMLAHGRQSDGRGSSRTRSFRKSFLLAYATRIGERLRAADEAAMEHTGRTRELVPVLRRRAEQVEYTRAQLFPELVDRRTTISNGYGWAAGRAAAELARLDADLRPVEAAR